METVPFARQDVYTYAYTARCILLLTRPSFSPFPHVVSFFRTYLSLTIIHILFVIKKKKEFDADGIIDVTSDIGPTRARTSHTKEISDSPRLCARPVPNYDLIDRLN